LVVGQKVSFHLAKGYIRWASMSDPEHISIN